LSDTTKLKARIDAHLIDILGATKGTLVEWDVVNEPSANKRLAKVVGEDEMVNWYKRAKELDGNAKMFLNDYGNLGEGSLDTEFKRIIKRLLELGAPIEGIGLQAHFGLQLTPPEELNSRLDAFGAFGLPLAITEFDVNTSNEPLQADYLRDFLTIAFANKNVSSFLMWGFWEGQHWLPDAAMYRKDWSIKPNGQVFKDLVFKTWWTNATGTSDATGNFETRGFYGDYKITATLGSRTVTKTFKLEPSSTGFDLTLP
jgi:endo-1,4-beta-xylanase